MISRKLNKENSVHALEFYANASTVDNRKTDERNNTLKGQ